MQKRADVNVKTMTVTLIKIVKRLLDLLMSVFLVSLLLYSLFHFLRGDSSSYILSEEASSAVMKQSPDAARSPGGFFCGYFLMMKNFFLLDWGRTIGGEDVRKVVFLSLPVSLSLALFSFLLSFPVSFLLSVSAAGKKGGAEDCILVFLSSVFMILPSFITSVALILLFSSALKLFPSSGYRGLSEGLAAHLGTLFLPSLSLSFINMSYMMRMFREALNSSMGKSYITYARASGMRERDLVRKAALKPALPVMITASAESLISFFASSTVVETVFALPGMGRALVRGALQRDTSLSFVIVMIMVLIISLVLFFSSLISLLIDRRGDKENGKA